MYERFYNLRERPFALSPDPEYLYPSRVHREALDYLRYGIETHAGFVMVTGEIGSGKTTMLQTVLRGLDNRTIVARIVNTMLEPRELLETIMIDLGLDATGKSKPVLLRDLAQFLIDQRMAGRLVLIVVDEAQNLSLATLEEIRMLSNLETEKSKLLQIVLVGQPELRDSLASDQLAQLRQRITVSYHLRPLDADETMEYINHRLRRAALGAPLQFPPEVTKLVFERSGGVPRLINVICDAVLVFGYAAEQPMIDRALAREVMAELETTGVLTVGAPAASVPAPAPAVSHVTAPARAAEFAAPSPAAPSVADAELLAREQHLQAREAALAARERELAEQRRVFTEEYRLMRRSLNTHARPPEPPQVTLVRPAGAVENVLARLWRALARSPEQPVTDRVSS
jgi:putative secretion ATPase (PEP-CTERM system associated)